METVFNVVIDACDPLTPSSQLSILTVLIDELTPVISTSQELRSKTLLALSSDAFVKALYKFIEAISNNERANCRTYSASQTQGLRSAIISSLLTLAFAAQKGEPTLPHGLVISLISKQRFLATSKNCCSHAPDVAERSTISLFQQASTPYSGQHLQDWRNRLNSELESQTHHHRDAIVRSVAQICQDLETRCNTVEEPLRREQEKTRGLERQVTDLGDQVVSLQARIADDELHLQGLENEKDLLEQEKRDLADQRDTVTARLEELELEFYDTTNKAQEALQEVLEIHNTKELEYKCNVLHNEEERRAHVAAQQESEQTISQLKEAQCKVESNYRALRDDCEDLRTRNRATEKELDDERRNTLRQAEEILQLRTRGFDVENQLHGTEVELETVAEKLSNMQVSHQELKDYSEQSLRDLEVKHSAEIEAAAHAAGKERDELHTRLLSTQGDLECIKAIHDKVQENLQILQTSVFTTESRLQDFQSLCAEQEEELEELRNIRRNVLVSMGIATQSPLAIRSASSSHKEAAETHILYARKEPRRRRSGLPAQEITKSTTLEAQGIANAVTGPATNASFTSSDSHSSQPIAKRSKPRLAFRAPTMQIPLDQNPTLTSSAVSKRLSPRKRSVLRQMSPNRRHTTVGFAIAENIENQQCDASQTLKKRRGSLHDLEKEDLDMDNDDFMAGTPLTPGNFMTGTGRISECDGETVAEL